MATSTNKIDKSKSRPFRCKRCDISFKFENSFNLHKQLHEKLDIANNETLTETETKTETTTTTSTTQITTTTKKATTIPDNVNLEHFQCNICSRQCTSYNALQKHLLVHSDEKPYECEICSISFKQKGNLTSHKKKHYGFNFTCAFCGKTFNNLGNLQTHENRHIAILRGSSQHIGKGDVDQMNGSATQLMEQQNNDDSKQVGRKKCGPKYFPCSQCDRTFLYKCYLTYHERTHSGDKPFKCSQCPVGFADKSNLRKHMRIHTGEKPFVCDICFKGFNQISSLSIHKRTHITYRPFECAHCHKTFGSNEELIVHLRIHGERLPFKCSECNLEFREHCNLKSHVKMHMETSPSLFRTITIRTSINNETHEETKKEKEKEINKKKPKKTKSIVENTDTNSHTKAPHKKIPIELPMKVQELPEVNDKENKTHDEKINDPPPIIINNNNNELTIKEEVEHDESEVKFEWYNFDKITTEVDINKNQNKKKNQSSPSFSPNDNVVVKEEPITHYSNKPIEMSSNDSVYDCIAADGKVDDQDNDDGDDDYFNRMDMFDDNSSDSIIGITENKDNLQSSLIPKIEFKSKSMIRFDRELKIILHKISLPIVKRKTIKITNLSINLKDLKSQQYYCRIVEEKSTNKIPMVKNELMTLKKNEVKIKKKRKRNRKKKKEKKKSNNTRRRKASKKIEINEGIKNTENITNTENNENVKSEIVIDTETVNNKDNNNSDKIIIDTNNDNNEDVIDKSLSFKCTELNCTRMYHTAKGLQRHRLLTHKLTLKCSICDESISRKRTIIKHMKEKHSVVLVIEKKKYKRNATFKCTTGCHKRFKNAKELAEHDCLFFRLKTHQCDICKRSFYSKDQIRQHMRVAHQRQGAYKRHKYKCSICNVTKFMLKDQFARHMKVHGLERNRECNECGKKFKTTGHLYNHKKTHLTELFKCSFCGKGFKTIGNLGIHEIRHRVADHPRFGCTICQKQFSFKHKLTYHMRTHTGDRPYACPMCPSRFADGSNLRAHKRIHTGEKPFKCLSCGKTFNQLGSLNIHKKSHVEYKPFKCEYCSKYLTSEFDLITHLRKYHGDVRLFKCRLCDREFEQLCNYKSHQRLHFGVELTNEEKNYRNKQESAIETLPTHLLPLEFAMGPAPLPAASLIFFPPEFQPSAATTAGISSSSSSSPYHPQLPLITYDLNNLN